jgi:NADH-quinone oxidoreductase subunit K
MITVSMEIQILLAALLFLMGLVGVLVRRNIIYVLMSIEIMLNSAGLVFIIAGSHWVQTDGQIMFIFILTVAAAEVSIGLALILQIYHHFKTLDIDAFSKLKDDVPLKEALSD